MAALRPTVTTMVAAAPRFGPRRVPALSTDATIESLLLHTVGAPSKALPRGSVAVTARLIVSPIERGGIQRRA